MTQRATEPAYIFQMFSFFFNDTATTEIYPLSLPDALPIYRGTSPAGACGPGCHEPPSSSHVSSRDRKSTCLNSSHITISYVFFCLKKHTIVCGKKIGGNDTRFVYTSRMQFAS